MNTTQTPALKTPAPKTPTRRAGALAATAALIALSAQAGRPACAINPQPLPPCHAPSVRLNPQPLPPFHSSLLRRLMSLLRMAR